MRNRNFYLKKVFKISIMGLLLLTSLATDQHAIASHLHGPTMAPPHVVLQVENPDDDVSQSVLGSTDLNLTVLTMGDTGGVSQFVGLRFSSVNVPQGAHITDAYLEFTALGDSPGVTTLSIAGHAADDSPAFSAGDGPMERQTEYTSATVTWGPIGWFHGMSDRSSPISSIVQEIVDRQNWVAGNAISLFVLDNGVDNVVRQAYSYEEDADLAPKLTIVYQETLKVAPGQILAQDEVVLEPPPGFTSSSWIYPADYSVGNLSLYRTYEPISPWHEPYDFGLSWYQPYLGYDLSIRGNGDILDEEQAEWVANQTLVRNLEGTIYTYGSEGTIYYHQMENAAPMCMTYGLLAFIPHGLSGDTNPANDWMVGTIEDELDDLDRPLDFDRDIRFTSEGPSANYWGPGDCTEGLWDFFSSPGFACGDFESGSPGYPSPESSAYIRVKTESEAIGACPPMLTDSEPFPFPGHPDDPIIEPIADLYHVWVTVFRNGDVVSLEGPFPPGVNPAVSLPEELENRDVICVDIELDPPMGNMDHGFILETNENNNRTMLLYGWNTNAWRGNMLYLAAEFTEPPIPTCQEATDQIEQIILDNYYSYLTIGSFVGILVFGLVGGTVGLFLGRRSTGTTIKVFLVASGVVGGAILGGLIGYIGGSALTPVPSDLPAFKMEQPSEIQPAAQPVIDLSSRFDQEETCEAYFKTYAEEVTNEDGEIEDIQIFIAVPSDVTLPADSRFQVTLWDNNGLPRQFATNNTVISLAETGFFPEQISNPLLWQVGLEVLAGSGGDLYLSHCLPDGLHTFKFEGLEDTQIRVTPETPTPTDTPTPTHPVPTKAPPTATTPPKAADTKGPKVSGASASPNPALTISPVTISATISDSSGVAKALVYIKTGKGGYQKVGKMKSGGGNNYFLNIGTLTPAGTYTFRILAEDSLGNANCSTSNLDACPGGTFEVKIP
jgi:hypothetical protein